MTVYFQYFISTAIFLFAVGLLAQESPESSDSLSQAESTQNKIEDFQETKDLSEVSDSSEAKKATNTKTPEAKARIETIDLKDDNDVTEVEASLETKDAVQAPSEAKEVFGTKRETKEISEAAEVSKTSEAQKTEKAKKNKKAKKSRKAKRARKARRVRARRARRLKRKRDKEAFNHAKRIILFAPRFAPVTLVTSSEYQEVIISGLAEPNQIISRGSQQISLLYSRTDIREITWEKALLSPLPIKVNEDGYFELRMQIPKGRVQIVLKYFSQKLVIVIDSNDTGVWVANGESLEKSPYIDGKYALWLGSGMNYVIYAQEVPIQVGIPTDAIDVEYHSLKGPSYFLKFEKRFAYNWNMNLAFKVSPGSTSSSENVEVNNGNYKWWVLSGEAIKFPKKLRKRLYHRLFQFGFNFGLQYHKVPFLNNRSFANFNMDSNSITMISGGGNILINNDRRLYYEIFMRGVIPVSSGSLFSITPKYSFDGSLGAIYRQSSDWRMGVFWYGAFQKYDFTVKSNNINGSQSMFFSNLEFRVGYTF